MTDADENNMGGQPRMNKRILGVLLLAGVSAACGHTATQKVGLMSLGDLRGRSIPDIGAGNVVEGSDCGYSYTLSNATRDAVKGTAYDTLVDVEVTNTTGLFVPSNCIRVRGKGVNSKTLPTGGGGQ